MTIIPALSSAITRKWLVTTTVLLLFIRIANAPAAAPTLVSILALSSGPSPLTGPAAIQFGIAGGRREKMPNWKGIVGKGFMADEFAAYVRTIHLDQWKPQFVVIHNTYIPKLSDWPNVPGQQRMLNFQSYYRDVKHWSAGPHLFIADDLIWIFTPLVGPGVHAPSWNAISWGIKLGDYSVEEFGPAVQANAITVLASLHALAGIDPGTLKLHKEDPKTTHKDCPGLKIIKEDIISVESAALMNNFWGEPLPGAMISKGL